MNIKKLVTALVLTAYLTVVAPGYCASGDWRGVVAANMPVLGHRNWIAIVNSAYPLQSRNGIQTIVTNADQITVLKTVLADVAASRHVRPIVYTDAELKYVSDKDAPGVSAYRSKLNTILAGRAANTLPHEQIIKKLDEAGQTFNILIVKTNMTIPYTSVFLQLNCKYWSDDAEAWLRAAMANKGASAQ